MRRSFTPLKNKQSDNFKKTPDDNRATPAKKPTAKNTPAKNTSTKKNSSASTKCTALNNPTNTIPALFAKQKLAKICVKTVVCPVCSVSVPLTSINVHLDDECGKKNKRGEEEEKAAAEERNKKKKEEEENGEVEREKEEIKRFEAVDTKMEDETENDIRSDIRSSPHLDTIRPSPGPDTIRPTPRVEIRPSPTKLKRKKFSSVSAEGGSQTWSSSSPVKKKGRKDDVVDDEEKIVPDSLCSSALFPKSASLAKRPLGPDASSVLTSTASEAATPVSSSSSSTVSSAAAEASASEPLPTSKHIDRASSSGTPSKWSTVDSSTTRDLTSSPLPPSPSARRSRVYSSNCPATDLGTPTKVNPFATPTKSKPDWESGSSFKSPMRSSATVSSSDSPRRPIAFSSRDGAASAASPRGTSSPRGGGGGGGGYSRRLLAGLMDIDEGGAAATGVDNDQVELPDVPFPTSSPGQGFRPNPGINRLAKSYLMGEDPSAAVSAQSQSVKESLKLRTPLKIPPPDEIPSPFKKVNNFQSSPSRSISFSPHRPNSTQKSEMEIKSYPSQPRPATPQSRPATPRSQTFYSPLTSSPSPSTQHKFSFSQLSQSKQSQQPISSPCLPSQSQSQFQSYKSPLETPKSPLHHPNRFWNKRRVSAGNEDAVVGVARKLWGPDVTQDVVGEGDRDGANKGSENEENEKSKHESTTTTTTWKPYYLENFLLILSAIESNSNDWRLFSSEDKKWFRYFLQNDDHDMHDHDHDDNNPNDDPDDDKSRIFLPNSPRRSLSELAQLLFVRLFQRKHRWLRRDQIKYDAIAEDLDPALKELVTSGLIFPETNRLDSLERVLDLLAAPDVKTLVKSQRIDVSKSGGTTKAELIEALLKQGSRQRSILDFASPKIVTATQTATAKPFNAATPTSFLSATTQRSTPSSTIPSSSSSSATSSSSSKGSKLLLVKAKALLGSAFKVADEPRNAFLRAILLFDMCGLWMDVLEDNNGQGSGNQLFKILLVNTGKLVYPSYQVDRRSIVFRTRRDLITWQEAVIAEQELRNSIDASEWDEAFDMFDRKRSWCRQILEDEDLIRHATSLPFFLRRYTQGWSAVKILSYGVDVLERRKDFASAVDVLSSLLDGQSVFCVGSRGKWFDRLTLNLDHHLRRGDEAWSRTVEGIKDDRVKAGRRAALWLRAEKMAAAKKKKKIKKKEGEEKDDFDSLLDEIPQELKVNLRPAFKRTIEGTLVPGMTGVYLSNVTSTTPTTTPTTTPVKTTPSSKTTTTTPSKLRKEGFEAVRVEEFTLRYYKDNLGYTDGIHSEGSIFSAIFVLLFWDVIFMPGIPDVFWNPFQTMPLDFFTSDFYENRKCDIDERVDWISKASVEDLVADVRTRWEKHEGTMVPGISWERFESAELLVDLIESMNSVAGSTLAAILRRLCRDFRHTRSGMPDLCLWNRRERKWMLVEVKGPNDKLSTKQMLWLDYFMTNEIPCEVCHVVAISNKKLKHKNKPKTPLKSSPEKTGSPKKSTPKQTGPPKKSTPNEKESSKKSTPNEKGSPKKSTSKMNSSPKKSPRKMSLEIV